MHPKELMMCSSCQRNGVLPFGKKNHRKLQGQPGIVQKTREQKRMTRARGGAQLAK